MSPREKNLRDALEALYRAHVRETGHQGGECANCFVAHAVLAETAPSPSPRPARKCMVCEDSGRVWFEGASRPCDACAPRPGDTKEGK